MSKILDITPEELEREANTLKTKAEEFKKEYENVYTAITDLKGTFKGDAANALNQKIESYREQLTKTDKLLSDYSEFMKNYAAHAKTTEEDIVSKAQSLNGGK